MAPSPWTIDTHSLVPPSQQLVAAVLDAMVRGELKDGERLPSVRGMAGMALVNPNTVTKAYRDLERMGATEGRNGSGVFVTPEGPQLACGVRLAETSAALLEAARAALRAGHTQDTLHQLLNRATDPAATDSPTQETTR